MKYTQTTIDNIISGIVGLKGRINACKEAGISYETFTEWMAGEIPAAVLKGLKKPEDIERKKSEFSYLIKKAEEVRSNKISDIAVLSIVNAMAKQWQAAAWWLERTDPDYRSKTATDITSQGERVMLGLPASPFANGEAKKAWDKKHPTPKKK